jgi:hypothetical protein
MAELSNVHALWQAVERAEAEWLATRSAWLALPDLQSWAGPTKARAKQLMDLAGDDLDRLVRVVRRVEQECEEHYRRIQALTEP